MKKRSFENDFIDTDTDEENASSFASRKKIRPMQSYQELMEDMERDMVNLGLNTTTMPKMNNSRKRRFDDTESDANGRLLSSSSPSSSSRSSSQNNTKNLKKHTSTRSSDGTDAVARAKIREARLAYFDKNKNKYEEKGGRKTRRKRKRYDSGGGVSRRRRRGRGRGRGNTKKSR